ncbi:hypothetical protein [Nonomuraea aridisoli]|uniref:DUF4439 domain-containing protein n=1 Tax=Nonomuraea aridisoli TaxID=2070368 RepID=A0A2W2EHY7_9ACTN|nr:hypothetical protein [Nonomuraea aridisoli]PZG16519.1 hypothetical protein C1J01_20745 [Nonomuraea aridisoli]
MRPRHLSRRALLAGGAAALTACSTSGPPRPSAPAPDSAETRLLRQLIAEKERTIALYSALIADGGDKLVPFRQRHQAHLAELREHVPPAPASPSPSRSPQSSQPSGSPSPSATEKPSLSRLRDAERAAAELRTRQLAGVSPGIAQLIASIGACEAAHALALPRSL